MGSLKMGMGHARSVRVLVKNVAVRLNVNHVRVDFFMSKRMDNV